MGDSSTNTAPPTTSPLEQEHALLITLSELQNLHERLLNLRTLLPERVLSPIFAALSAPSPDTKSTPTDLYAQLTKTTKRGFDELQAFKTSWQSERLERARKRAKIEDVGQGDDVFREDYSRSLKRLEKRKAAEEAERKKKEGAGSASSSGNREDQKKQQQPPDPELEIVDSEPPAAVLKQWRDSDKEEKLQFSDVSEDAESFDVRVPSMKLHVSLPTPTSTSASPLNAGAEAEDRQSRTWHVSSAAGTKPFPRKEKVVDFLNKRKNKHSLRFLLDLLATYSTFHGQNCPDCGWILGKDLDIPFLRRRELVKNDDDSGGAENARWAWVQHHPEGFCQERERPGGGKEEGGIDGKGMEKEKEKEKESGVVKREKT
ncbi:MAG: hypothetical protein Q9227_003456 [Pyrenula ochraceoflavens]